MTPQDDEDQVGRLLKQTYQAPPADPEFTQALADRLQQHIRPARHGSAFGWRRWGLAVAACLLVGAALAWWTTRQRQTAGTQPEVVRPGPVPTLPQTVPNDIQPTR
jgi:hypothetical protein